jgi:hypothetical protein
MRSSSSSCCFFCFLLSAALPPARPNGLNEANGGAKCTRLLLLLLPLFRLLL